MPVQVKAIFPTAAGALTTGLSPLIESRRSDTDAIQDTGSGIMVEVGATGLYTYTHPDGIGTSFDPDLEWYYSIDGTASAPAQVRRQIATIQKNPLDDIEERILSDATPFQGADIAAILADTAVGGAGPWTTATGFETEADAATRAAADIAQHGVTQGLITTLSGEVNANTAGKAITGELDSTPGAITGELDATPGAITGEAGS